MKQITKVVTIMLALLLVPYFAPAEAAKAGAQATDIESLLDDYSRYLSTDTTSYKASYNSNMLSLVQERQSFYAEFFKIGLHSTLTSLKSEFIMDDIELSKTDKIIHIKVMEVITMYGQTDVTTPEDYPLIPAARWAISKTNDKAVQDALQRYIVSTTESVNESIKNGVEEVFRVNHSIDIARQGEGLQIVRDEFTDWTTNEQHGHDNVIWINGMPVRKAADLTAMPDYVFFHSAVEVLGQQLLNDYTKAFGGTFNFAPTPSLFTYSYYYNGQTAKNYALAYTTSLETSKCPNDPSVIMDTSKYNLEYQGVWNYTTITCDDCADYVSQALKAGGVPTNDTWHPIGVDTWGGQPIGTYAWRVFDEYSLGPKQGLMTYLRDTRQSITEYSSYTGLLVGDLIYTSYGHVAMVTRIAPFGYSGHTNDRKNHAYMADYAYFWHVKDMTVQFHIFADVLPTHWAWRSIESLYNYGVTAGCGNNNYCPNAQLTRAQMAVFMLRSKYGKKYTPPAATGNVFNDVPANYWAAAWIEQYSKEGITAGCGGGNYCPEQLTNKAQMAVFLLRAKYGNTYTPPAATGEVFDDVPLSTWAPWIEELYEEEIGFECRERHYCPDAFVSRADMAAFLVPTFNMP